MYSCNIFLLPLLHPRLETKVFLNLVVVHDYMCLLIKINIIHYYLYKCMKKIHQLGRLIQVDSIDKKISKNTSDSKESKTSYSQEPFLTEAKLTSKHEVLPRP